MAVRKRQSSGRTMRGSGIANTAGVATKAEILNRNQQLLESLVCLLKEPRKMLSI
jgi:hypothetical protein